jgi:hypothetical protein
MKECGYIPASLKLITVSIANKFVVFLCSSVKSASFTVSIILCKYTALSTNYSTLTSTYDAMLRPDG